MYSGNNLPLSVIQDIEMRKRISDNAGRIYNNLEGKDLHKNLQLAVETAIKIEEELNFQLSKD